MEISNWIAHRAEWAPAKTALRFEGEEITYGCLEDRIANLAALLGGVGVAAGDRVVYLGPSCIELLESFFACARLGAIFVPLNSRMPPAELVTFVEQTNPRAFVVEESFRETVRLCAPATPGRVFFSIGKRIEGASDLAPVRADPDANPSAPVLILFTSGTTGRPKGAVMTNDSLIANAADTASALEMTANDEVLTFTPMFHVAGLNLLTTPALSIGATVTVHREFQPRAVLEDIEARAVTLLVASPPMTAELIADPAWDDTHLTGLRCVLVGGTSVTKRSVQPWRRRNVPVVQSYGMTEAGPHATLVPLHDVPLRSLTAGKPMMRCQVRITDPSDREVERGERGEIVVRGPAVMREYWQNAEATRQALRNGWLRTGDAGFIDGDGYLHVVDRIKEIIITGTSNVYPADLEAVLAESPDISAAAVVARPDEVQGEVPVAFVVPAAGSSLSVEHILSLFEGRLASYKHPRDVIFLDAMPRTSVGKPEKKALRAMAHARWAALSDSTT